jgi:hypothetical protein
MFRRAASFVAALALCAGNVAVCAGWQATPAARMACCTDDACPVHKSDNHDHSSKRAVSQTEADSCCGIAAQQRNSAAAGSTFAASGVITLVPVAAFAASVSAFLPQEWRTVVPLPVSSTPKHLLLSVLLV